MEQNKTVEQNETMDQNTMDINRIPNGAPVNVKLSKMVDGVFYIFAGVMEILRSLDPSEAKKFVSEFADAPDSSDAADTVSELANRANGRTTSVANDTPVAQGNKTPAEAQTEVKSVPSITVDDITKVIVAKIKQKRSNNEAIGALLKSYGVAKVSELPEAKYEAFITDLSQI